MVVRSSSMFQTCCEALRQLPATSTSFKSSIVAGVSIRKRRTLEHFQRQEIKDYRLLWYSYDSDSASLHILFVVGELRTQRDVLRCGIGQWVR